VLSFGGFAHRTNKKMLCIICVIYTFCKAHHISFCADLSKLRGVNLNEDLNSASVPDATISASTARATATPSSRDSNNATPRATATPSSRDSNNATPRAAATSPTRESDNATTPRATVTMPSQNLSTATTSRVTASPVSLNTNGAPTKTGTGLCIVYK
jgi:hypothetical protein